MFSLSPGLVNRLVLWTRGLFVLWLVCVCLFHTLINIAQASCIYYTGLLYITPALCVSYTGLYDEGGGEWGVTGITMSVLLSVIPCAWALSRRYRGFCKYPLDRSTFSNQSWCGEIVQELCESRGGRPGLSVLTSLLVSVDVKIY